MQSSSRQWGYGKSMEKCKATNREQHEQILKKMKNFLTVRPQFGRKFFFKTKCNLTRDLIQARSGMISQGYMSFNPMQCQPVHFHSLEFQHLAIYTHHNVIPQQFHPISAVRFWFRSFNSQCQKLWLLISVVIYYERKIIPSVCRFFAPEFAHSE